MNNAAEKNIPFYNEIAGDYDAIMDKEGTNEIIRKRVQEKFTDIVKQGCVLDFGGGTGSDLDWLINNKYRIIFCEPSTGMRQKAINKYKHFPNVNFLENGMTDFSKWLANPPFETKVDAIISNFAVINCIADIDLLFASLSRLIKPRGHFMALMLLHGYKKPLRWQIKKFINNLFSDGSFVINVQFKDFEQTVYVHSSKAVKKAADPYFHLHSRENLYEFTLFHFIRK